MTTVYSFDLFDTLVCRSVIHPTSVFSLIEHNSSVSYKHIIYRKIGFRKLRVLAEKIARKKSKKEDVTFDEIYSILSYFIHNINCVKQMEIDCEKSALFPIEENVEILKSYIEKGYQCCIVSDMYLPLDVITDIINKKIGVDIPIFLSSEYMKTKHSGNLYAEVQKYFKVEYSEILHHGDNEYSDIEVAKKLGIKTVKIKEYNYFLQTDNFFKILKPIKPERLDNVFYELGFYLVAPCVWSTVRWMEKDTKLKNIDKVFFGSRDGFLFHKFFKELTDINSSYFRVSRRLLYLPCFAVDDKKNIIFEGNRNLTASEFFKRIDLDCPQELLSLNPFDNQKIILDEIEKQGFYEKCNLELDNLLLYLNLIGFKGNIAFFDLGWRGTLQNALNKVLKDVNINGYYFGLTEKDNKEPNFNAFYFYKNKFPKRKTMIYQSVAFFEYLFTEPTQSLKTVKVNNNSINYEYVENEDSIQSLNNRKLIIEGALDFLKIIKPLENSTNMVDFEYGKNLEEQIRKYIMSPSKELVTLFSGIDHSDSFGGFDTKKILQSGKFSISAYRKSFWKSGYVNSLSGLDKVYAKMLHFFLYDLRLIYFKHRVANLLKYVKGFR